MVTSGARHLGRDIATTISVVARPVLATLPVVQKNRLVSNGILQRQDLVLV